MELIEVAPPRPRRRFWLQFVLLLCFLTCLILGLGSLTALLMLRNVQMTSSETTALPAVAQTGIVPQLALNVLAGDPAEALVLQSAKAGEVETAWALLAFDTTISESDKAFLYALLSRRLVEIGLSQREYIVNTREIQRLARATIILAPDVNSDVQGRVLAQSVSDLLFVGATEDAFLSAVNLQRLGERLPDLLPVQRRQLLEPLSEHSKALDSADFEQRLAELLRNPFLSPTGELLPLQLSSMIVEPDSDAALRAAVMAREEAARSEALRLQQQAGEADPTSLARLAEALRLEEIARRQFTEPRLADPNLKSDERLGILLQRYQWATRKAQIATRGFGLSIVPEWEQNLSQIEDELSLTVQEIDKTIDQLMESLPEAKDKAALRVEKFLWLVLQAERGLFPGASLPLLSNDLRFAQAELESQGTLLALPVFWDAGLKKPEFMIQPARQ